MEPKTLKRAFRKLALRYHPDIAREGADAGKFATLQDAYRILSEGETMRDLPDDLEWSHHDWRWQQRYKDDAHGGGARGDGDGEHAADASARTITEEERKAKLEEQLQKMAGAPVKRKRRKIKPLSETAKPTPQPSAAAFTEVFASEDEDEEKEEKKKEKNEEEDGDDAAASAASSRADDDGGPSTSGGAAADTTCDVSDGCSTEEEYSPLDADGRAAFNARKTRGYQSDRHSTESAHDRLNAQLAGLQRKRVIRARAMGIDLDVEKRNEEKDAEVKAYNARSNKTRFYGCVGLQLEESTPERFLRLAKLAKEWREQRGLSDIIYESNGERLSARELLQAAVEGASMGACA